MALSPKDVLRRLAKLPADRQAQALTLARQVWGTSSVHKTESARQLEAAGARVWLKTLFPHIFTRPFASFHIEAWEWYWAALVAKRDGLPLPDGNALFCIWFRGGSKSTHAEMMPIAEAAVVGEGLCLYTSGTQSMANKHLAAIDEHLQSPEVAEFYPPLSRPVRGITGQSKGWRQEFIQTEHGYRFIAVGLDVGVRGIRVGKQRPSLIIPDDIDSREDSPALSEAKMSKFLHNVLPTKTDQTIIICAQNLVIEHGVINQIYTGKVRALAQALVLPPVPMVKGLVTEEKTINGRVRDVIVSGSPTWEVCGLDRAQEDIDTYTLKVFNAECQHDLSSDKSGLMLPEFSDAVHVIKWSEFARMFPDAQRRDARGEVSYRVPARWRKYVGHDWANTRSDYHANVVSFVAVSPKTSPFPNAHFLYAGLSFDEGALPDDVALRVLETIEPAVEWAGLLESGEAQSRLAAAGRERVLGDALEARRQVVTGLIRPRAQKALERETFALWHMSHEQKTTRQIYRDVFGLPFQACNPGSAGGVTELRGTMRVDYQTPHAFRPGQLGFTRFYLIVADEQLKHPTDDLGLALWREQFKKWRWRLPKLTESGLQDDRPLKMFDDCGNSLMMLYVHRNVMAAPLSPEEAQEVQRPPALRNAAIAQMTSHEEVTRAMAAQHFYDDERERARQAAEGPRRFHIAKPAGRAGGFRRS